MSNQAQAAQGSTATAKPITFKQMNALQKCVFIGKAVICICTFGFAFSHIFSES